MLLALASIAAGLGLLVWSADRFVVAASALARNLGVPPLLVETDRQERKGAAVFRLRGQSLAQLLLGQVELSLLQEDVGALEVGAHFILR